MTNHAINKNKITVFGGDQLRPNLHVEDYCDAVMLLMAAPTEKVANETFNIGYENMSIMSIAEIVKTVVEEEFPEKAPSKLLEPRAMTIGLIILILIKSLTCWVINRRGRFKKLCVIYAKPLRKTKYPTALMMTFISTSKDCSIDRRVK